MKLGFSEYTRNHPHTHPMYVHDVGVTVYIFRQQHLHSITVNLNHRKLVGFTSQT
ncbi:hypothetical protein HanPSC8_Chr13g0593201 [Helianthus annuus]|nr:hypothetical protein HanPSC8_Chr13g0593201 [Helianthus annuus]